MPSLPRSLALLLLAILVFVGCQPDGEGASPTSAATMAVARTPRSADAPFVELQDRHSTAQLASIRLGCCA